MEVGLEYLSTSESIACHGPRGCSFCAAMVEYTDAISGSSKDPAGLVAVAVMLIPRRFKRRKAVRIPMTRRPGPAGARKAWAVEEHVQRASVRRPATMGPESLVAHLVPQTDGLSKDFVEPVELTIRVFCLTIKCFSEISEQSKSGILPLRPQR